ncbi:MAG: hypothetical protein J6N45_01665, partial [Alphaproteobacteria bacterium]|nr:hypothetical protein [Alphaproteobacteria bacterium]
TRNAARDFMRQETSVKRARRLSLNVRPMPAADTITPNVRPVMPHQPPVKAVKPKNISVINALKGMSNTTASVLSS